MGLGIGNILAERFGDDFVKKLVIYSILGVVGLLILLFLIVFLAVIAGNKATK